MPKAIYHAPAGSVELEVAKVHKGGTVDLEKSDGQKILGVPLVKERVVGSATLSKEAAKAQGKANTKADADAGADAADDAGGEK